ncbi:MAG: nitrophenyl compound nitroreductase subunit ArsF family protein [Planctomycetota bacterium]
MELKNAVAVCLISLFSATLVVLIARTLDSQATSPLEGHLETIAEELQTIRKQGGITAASGGTGVGQSADDGLMVYYFHGVRCPTCIAAESQAHETVRSDFASQLESREVIWKVLDYVKDPVAAKLARKFDVAASTVVLARMKDGQIEDWRRLDRVLVLVNDKPAFAAYIRDEIGQMLKSQESGPTPPPDDNSPDIPIPDPDLLDIPVPTEPADVAVPQ